jgi:methionyl-tRNA formyltransferase
LEALIEKYEVIGAVTQPDKLVGRKQVLTSSPVKECAIRHNIPVFQPKKILTEYTDIMELKPDLIVTAAYGQFVGMKLLNSPKYRSINVHGSLLPKYRGGAPIQASIKNGEKETGITIMYMEKAMDAGDILSQRAIPITDEDNCQSMFDKLSYLGRDLLMETIPLLVEGKLTPIKQDESKVTFAYNVTPEEEALDFTKDARQVFNHIRAYDPEPGAYFKLGDIIIKAYKSRISGKTHDVACGDIVDAGKDYFSVACGNHTVLDILTVQPSGKRIMSAQDFNNGLLRNLMKKRG